MTRIEHVEGTAIPVRGNDIDTDRIIPARFLKSITFEGLGAHLFEDDRAQDPQHPFNNPAFDGAAILIANRNFGCGSSREHAPQALRLRGIRAVVAESFSEIFFGNSLALGLPCLAAPASDIAALMAAVDAAPTLRVRIDVQALRVTAGELTMNAAMPRSAHDALISGQWDATGMLLHEYDDVRAVAARLPYVAGWR